MAVAITCDLCGELIEDKSRSVRLEASGISVGVYGSIGHYHSSVDQPCWDEMLDRVKMIHEISADLGFKPKPIRSHAPERDPKWAQHNERQGRWRKMSVDERAEIVLSVLGGDTLTGTEIADLINDGLGVDRNEGDIDVVYAPEVRRLAQRLVADGKLRAATESSRSHLRYRYSLNSESVA